MTRHRIIKIIEPILTKNITGNVDFVPEILLEEKYEIQVRYSIFSSWETLFSVPKLETAKILLSFEKLKIIKQKVNL